MSGAALGWAKSQVAPTSVAKAVLICLADYADADGAAWPAVPTLAREVQVSERTVQRTLRALEEAGLIVGIDRARQDGGTTARRYTLALAPVTACHRPPGASVTPPVTLLSPATDPPVERVGSDEPSAVAKATEPPADFMEAWKGYPHVKGRSSRADTFTAWRKLDRAGRSALPAAVAAFASHERQRQKRIDDPGPPAMERWLKRRLFDQWVAVEQPDLIRVSFDGPPELRAEIAVFAGDGFASAYVDTAHWLDSPPTLLTRTGVAADRLRREVGHLLRRRGVEVRLGASA